MNTVDFGWNMVDSESGWRVKREMTEAIQTRFLEVAVSVVHLHVALQSSTWAGKHA